MAYTARTITLTLCLALFALVSPLPADAASPADVCRTGQFPRQGKIVIRSGLAWMNETAPAFQTMARGVEKELASLGLQVVPYAKPSALDKMPETPLNPNTNRPAASDAKKNAPKPAGPSVSGEVAQEKAGSLGKEGKLPKLKLRSYGAPKRDADLPQSVKAIRPPDVSRAMYAKSQELGRPVVQNFAIPGRVPAELESDAEYADYALVVRFASVRSWGALPENSTPEYFMGLPGTLVAAATIRGTGALGYGPPASPSSSAPPNTYGTPGGFVRGYEGAYPNDFWGRDRDYFQRDYQFKHGEPPQYAKPPKDFTPGTHQGFGNAPEFGSRHTMNIDEWILIFIDCYDLAPARNGQKPAVIWSVSARKPVQGEGFAKGVESLARAAFAVNSASPATSR